MGYLLHSGLARLIQCHSSLRGGLFPLECAPSASLFAFEGPWQAAARFLCTGSLHSEEVAELEWEPGELLQGLGTESLTPVVPFPG